MKAATQELCFLLKQSAKVLKHTRQIKRDVMNGKPFLTPATNDGGAASFLSLLLTVPASEIGHHVRGSLLLDERGTQREISEVKDGLAKIV